MTRCIALLCASVVYFIAIHVQAASGDDNFRTCALTKAFECTSANGCRESTVQEMALPRFILIDLKAKIIKSLDKDITRETRFKEMDRLDGLLVLHGTEQRGWSLALGEKSNDLTLTASGDGESFVVFGSCMSK